MNMLHILLNFKALAYPVRVNFVEKRNATQLSSAWVFSHQNPQKPRIWPLISLGRRQISLIILEFETVKQNIDQRYSDMYIYIYMYT